MAKFAVRDITHDDEVRKDDPRLGPPLSPDDRFRMRRLTDAEMEHLRQLARCGRSGPAKALDALWDLILREAEGIGVEEAATRPGSYRVQDYAMPTDQAKELLDAMTQRRRLPPRVVGGFHQLWAFHSPADYDDAPPTVTEPLRGHPGETNG